MSRVSADLCQLVRVALTVLEPRCLGEAEVGQPIDHLDLPEVELLEDGAQPGFAEPSEKAVTPVFEDEWSAGRGLVMLYVSEARRTPSCPTNGSCGRADELLERLRERGPLRRVLLIPPDYTRAHSGAGALTCRLFERFQGEADVAILPATGTHFPMEEAEREAMFPGIPAGAFRSTTGGNGVVTLGEVPAAVMEELSEGRVRLPAAVQVDRLLTEVAWDAIISVGQLVPHEVIGIANHVKNILVGAGGHDMIHKSHWLGAVYGMERIMGRTRTPVRALLNWASDRYLRHLPISIC